MVYSIMIAFLTAYLLGNLNGAVCVSALIADDDVRKHGSGNAGLTNFLRMYGPSTALLVVAIDVLKAVAACFLGKMLLNAHGYALEGVLLGGLEEKLGHDFPALLGFRGGKGILCGLATAMVLDWRIGIALIVVFAIAFGITRYVSLGSVLGAVTFIAGFVILYHQRPWVMVGGIVLGALAIFMHRENIVRLYKGTESKVHLIHRDLNK